MERLTYNLEWDAATHAAGPEGREERKRRREAAIASGSGVEMVATPETRAAGTVTSGAPALTVVPARPLEVCTPGVGFILQLQRYRLLLRSALVAFLEASC